MNDAMAMVNCVAENVKVMVMLKKNVQNVKAVEESILTDSHTIL